MCGRAEGEVITSTVSPFDSSWRSGTSAPLTRAPTQWKPTSVWIMNAKSRGVAPLGSRFSSRRGV